MTVREEILQAPGSLTEVLNCRTTTLAKNLLKWGGRLAPITLVALIASERTEIVSSAEIAAGLIPDGKSVPQVLVQPKQIGLENAGNNYIEKKADSLVKSTSLLIPRLTFPLETNIFDEIQKQEMQKQMNLALVASETLFGPPQKNISTIEVVEQTPELLTAWGRTEDFRGAATCEVNKNGRDGCTIFVAKNFGSQAGDRTLLAHEFFHVAYGGPDYPFRKIVDADLKQMSGRLDIGLLFDEEAMAAFVANLATDPTGTKYGEKQTRWLIYEADPNFYFQIIDLLIADPRESLTHEDVTGLLKSTKSKALPIIFGN